MGNFADLLFLQICLLPVYFSPFVSKAAQRSVKLPKIMQLVSGRFGYFCALCPTNTPFYFQRHVTQNELIDQLTSDLHRLLDQVRKQFAPLEEAVVQYRPDPTRWNILECFAHLNVFAEMYLSRIESSIHKAKARNWQPAAELHYTASARRDIRRADLVNNKPRKTKKIYNFHQRTLGPEVIKTFIIHCERLLRNLQAAREVDLNRPKIGRGSSGFFHYSLGNTFEWLIRHAQRHVAQAQELVGLMQGRGLL